MKQLCKMPYVERGSVWLQNLNVAAIDKSKIKAFKL